jgi:hypothetical protein
LYWRKSKSTETKTEQSFFGHYARELHIFAIKRKMNEVHYIVSSALTHSGSTKILIMNNIILEPARCYANIALCQYTITGAIIGRVEEHRETVKDFTRLLLSLDYKLV